MGDLNEYIKQLESDNEVLRSKLFDMYTAVSKRSIMSLKYDKDGNSCHNVAMNGGCGCDCPVFLNGTCEVPDGALDFIKEQIESFQEMLETYELRYENRK